jgi:hypothetical protein
MVARVKAHSSFEGRAADQVSGVVFRRFKVIFDYSRRRM